MLEQMVQSQCVHLTQLRICVNELGGTPDVGGTWSPALTSGTGMFDPSVDAAGTYTYTVTNSCGSVSADVVVTITANPSAGTNGAIILL